MVYADTISVAVKARAATAVLIYRVEDGYYGGSAVAIDSRGYLVSNEHVVRPMTTGPRVILANGTELQGLVVGSDDIQDIALIYVGIRLPDTLPWGNSDLLQIGEEVIAVGNPAGDFPGTVTRGIVSGLFRNIDQHYGLVQTDAHVNYGDSGGPLVNQKGELVGINSYVYRLVDNRIWEGMSFAIPSNKARVLVEPWITKFERVKSRGE